MTRAFFVRFSRRQRVEHFSIMMLFTVLCITGLPQKFFENSVSVWLLTTMGGVDRARAFHRLAGLLFAGLATFHFSGVILDVIRGRSTFSMVPTRKDFSDAILTLRYYLGTTDAQARFDRYDYRQKFEYWGLVLGAVVVISTGIILYWPVVAAQFLPGEFIPAAKVAHSNEGLLAFLVVILWHVYNAHFNPDVFPFDKSIFTGQISYERMHHEHPIELERLARDHSSVTYVAHDAADRAGTGPGPEASHVGRSD